MGFVFVIGLPHQRGGSAALYFNHFSERLNREREDIAYAALRLDYAWRTWEFLQFSSMTWTFDMRSKTPS
jgi:hypothetical protein